MTNPIELLEQRLREIEQAKEMCQKTDNIIELPDVIRHQQMYQSSIDAIKNTLKII